MAAQRSLNDHSEEGIIHKSGTGISDSSVSFKGEVNRDMQLTERERDTEREREKERETYRQEDRQTDKQTD